jgi:hypothetical protein
VLTAGLYAHCRTAGQLHTAARAAGQPHTAAHTATHCCTHREDHTPHTALLHTPQLTWIKLILFESAHIYMNLCELIWIHLNLQELYLNVHEFTCIFTWFYFKLSDLFRIHTDLYECILNLFENMLTAAPLDSRTLPRDCRTSAYTLPHRTLLHCRTQPCALLHTAAHCMNSNAGQPHTAQRLLHTVAHCNWHDLKQCCVNVYAFTWTYLNLCESIWIHMNNNNFIWVYTNLHDY